MRLLVLLIVASLTAFPAPSGASSGPAATNAAAAGPSESVQVLMPFDGQWANDFNTAPWEHSRIPSEDWTMDVFAPNEDVYANFERPTGDLQLHVQPPIPYGCTNGGSMVWVDAYVDGVHVGRVGYHHLTDVTFPDGKVIDGSAVRVGRTVATPGVFGGGCWNVSTPGGIHVHIVADNAAGYSCYVRYDKGSRPGPAAPLMVLGGSDGESWGKTPRDECPFAALEVGTPIGIFVPPTRHGPYELAPIGAGHLAAPPELAFDPMTGTGLTAWAERSFDDDAVRSWANRIASDATPVGEPIALFDEAGQDLRLEDVSALAGGQGWLIAGAGPADATLGVGAERVLVAFLSPHDTSTTDVGTELTGHLELDPGRDGFSVVVAQDPVDGTQVVAWTRPGDAGHEVMAARLNATGTAITAGPVSVGVGDPGNGMLLDTIDIATDGQVLLVASEGLVVGDAAFGVATTIFVLGRNLAVDRSERLVPGADESFGATSASFSAAGNILSATTVVPTFGVPTLRTRLWVAGQPASAPTAALVGADEYGRVVRAPDGGFQVLTPFPNETGGEVLVAYPVSDVGQVGPPIIDGRMQPLTDDAVIDDVAAVRSELDGSLRLATIQFLGDSTHATSARAFQGPTIEPTAPRNLQVAVVDGSPVNPGVSASALNPGDALLVTWDPPASDGGEVVDSYVVTAMPGGVSVTVAGTETSALLTGLDGNVNYDVTVQAANTNGSGPPPLPITVLVPSRPAEGYWMLESDGTVYTFGDSPHHGNAAVADAALQIEPTASGDGYWVLDLSGTVHAFGDAPHHGNLADSGVVLDAGEVPATLSARPDDAGYWIFTNRGRVIAFGAAEFFGDVSHLTLAGPVIASVATPTGEGYFQVGSDGGIFANGDAVFQGSVPQVLPGVRLNQPVVGISPTPTNDGYWLVAADGGVFAFGNAPFRGSVPGVLPPGVRLNQPVNGMVAYGDGYLLVASDGGVFEFSNQQFLGSLGASPPDDPIVGIAPIR